MKPPTLSVVIPNYNHGRYLPNCLEAVLGQSLAANEILVIDDASTDHSVEVISDYARRHPTIRLVRNERNQGVVYGMNRGLELASGAYLYFAAADDQVLPGFFERLLNLLAAHPRAALGCGIGEWREVATGLRWHVGVGNAAQPAFLSPERLVQLERKGQLFIPSNATIFKREAVLQAGGFIPELKWHCDWFAMYVSAFRAGLCFVPEVVAVAHIHETSYHSAGRRDPVLYRQVLRHLLERLLRPEYSSAMEAIRTSGALFLFGWPILQLILSAARYRLFLNRTFLRKNLWHIARLKAKRLTPRCAADLYFRLAGYRARTTKAKGRELD
jgi:glycosyltransferase involved in cell wall biosynthesis